MTTGTGISRQHTESKMLQYLREVKTFRTSSLMMSRRARRSGRFILTTKATAIIILIPEKKRRSLLNRALKLPTKELCLKQVQVKHHRVRYQQLNSRMLVKSFD